MSSWFVPTEIGEEGEDGNPTKVVSHFGPGMDAVAEVEQWQPPGDGPGRVERGPAGEGAHPNELLLLLDEPAPGLAHLFVLPMGPQVMAVTRLYLYGDEAAEAAEQTEPEWQEWIGTRFAPAEGGSPPEA